MATKQMKELKDERERASTWKSLDIVGSRKETLRDLASTAPVHLQS
jgi:hypothetical protein